MNETKPSANTLKTFADALKDITTYRESDGYYKLSNRLIFKIPSAPEEEGFYHLIALAENGGTTQVIVLTDIEASTLLKLLLLTDSICSI
jgi:hypothetical protein